MFNSVLYNIIFIPAFLLYLPFFIRKLIKRGGAATDFGERFGLFSQEKKAALHKLHKPVLVHAVSVGEVVAAVNFMKRWQQRDPALQFVLSVTTTTGHAMALQKVPTGTVCIYSPLDFLWSVRSALRWVNPGMLVIFEVEIWPNLIRQSHRRNIPLALVNCRMSDSSSKGYARFSWFFKPLFDAFTIICAQSSTDIERIAAITGSKKRTLLCNTMKFDQLPPVLTESGNRQEFVDRAFGKHSRIFTAASTHTGEETIILELYKELMHLQPGLKLILAPRHSERSDAVEQLIQDVRLSYTKLTDDVPGENVDVLLINTTGELLNFLAVSDIVFVGKSMFECHGGQNIIEPALLKKVVIHGPNMENFEYVVSAFQQEGASLVVRTKEELKNTLLKLFADEAYQRQQAQKAFDVVEKYRGAIDKTIDALRQIESAKTPNASK